MLLISNGRVVDPASGTEAPRDILLDGDRIVAVAAHGQLTSRAEGAEVFDAKNLLVAPGFMSRTIPKAHEARLIELGLIRAAMGGLMATPAGRMVARIQIGR